MDEGAVLSKHMTVLTLFGRGRRASGELDITVITREWLKNLTPLRLCGITFRAESSASMVEETLTPRILTLKISVPGTP